MRYGCQMKKELLIATTLVLGLGGGAAALVSRAHIAQSAQAASVSIPEPATLKEALAVSTRLGPVAGGTIIDLELALHPRHAKALQHLLDTGQAGSTSNYAQRYGPNPALVRPALAAARRAGLHASWTIGEGTAMLAGPARAVEGFFQVRLFRYVTPDHRQFYAADRNPILPLPLKRAVDGVAGFDNYAQLTEGAIPAGGVSPRDVMVFYDISPLRASGLDGSGVTVVFPELNSPADIPQVRRDVAEFSQKNGLPPANLTIRTDAAWGASPSGASDPGLIEVDLDLEIVHSIAPAAKLVVYLEPPNTAAVGAEAAMVQENPTAIISNSIGLCELGIGNLASLKVAEQPWIQQAAQNMTHYVAAGDSGAYQCGQKYKPTVDFPADLPIVTAVGGTSVLLARSSGYFRELAWGNALTKAGGGGGVTQVFQRPPYQTGAGFPPVSSAPGRLIPDVAGLADANTGWSIITGGKATEIGGTSAAAPLWSGITALIDQDMKRHGLREVGLANLALYWIGEHQSQFHAFHDVTAGNNLYYDAVPGWDNATGWGTPDAAKLDLAWRAYISQGGK